MKKNCIGALSLLIFLCLTGCLEIDGQDVWIRHDEEQDRIDAVFVHRGLFAESGKSSNDEPLASSLKHIADARETGEFMFWNNWPLACNPSKDFKGPEKALVAHIEVENGDLFTDPQGVLCAYQFVRINNAKSFLKKVNTLLELGVQAMLTGATKRFGNHKFDSDSKENVREFLRSREQMLAFENGRLELRLPFSPKDARWALGQLEQHFFDNLPGEILRRVATAERREADGSVTDTSYSADAVIVSGTELAKGIREAPSMRFFWDNDISLERSETLMTIALGATGSEEIRFKKASGGLYHDALLNKLRENGETIEDGLPDPELSRRFEEFRSREAKLPAKLAAKRGN